METKRKITNEEAKAAARRCIEDAEREWRKLYGGTSSDEEFRLHFIQGWLRSQLENEIMITGSTIKSYGA